MVGSPSKKDEMWFAGLCGAYTFVWVPAFYAYFWLNSKGNESSKDAHVPPPVFVLVSVIIIFLLFLLFPIAYGINLERGLPIKVEDLTRRERLYTLASMIAKVSLHAVIGFAVIGQSAALDNPVKRVLASTTTFTTVAGTTSTITTPAGTQTSTATGDRSKYVYKLKELPRDDNDTLISILATVGGSILVLSFVTWWATRIPNKARALKRLHTIAAVVHLLSASVILGVALNETNGNLSRYQSKPDFGRFLRPEQWIKRCFNKTSGVINMTKVAECPGKELVDVFSNEHRGKGPLNIAVLAFVFAFWSGAWHVVALKFMSGSKWVDVDGIGEGLAKCRWADYLLSAPLMLLTLNVIFAATNFFGVVLAPLLLFGLLALAAVVEIAAFNVVSNRLLWQLLDFDVYL